MTWFQPSSGPGSSGLVPNQVQKMDKRGVKMTHSLIKKEIEQERMDLKG
jgi:hypothetical protein